MKRRLLLLALMGTLGMSAQTTHHINWGLGDNSTGTSMTIEQGDSVEWMWTTTHPHTVTSEPGSTEEFDSGIKTGIGQTFTHEFTEAGTNPYICQIHDGMAGTITVDAVAGVEEVMTSDFMVYPNPTTDILTINAKQNIDKIEIYDMNGRLVLRSDNAGNPSAKIYMQNYNAGTYLVKAYAGELTKTMSVIKK